MIWVSDKHFHFKLIGSNEKSSFFKITGEAERVEMVIDDVVVEVSKHRGIGRVYLTNFRCVLHMHVIWKKLIFSVQEIFLNLFVQLLFKVKRLISLGDWPDFVSLNKLHVNVSYSYWRRSYSVCHYQVNRSICTCT